MPEVAEVAHVCALLRRNVLGFKIASVKLNNDRLLFPCLKNDPLPLETLQKMENDLVNSEISSVGRHGKYFWLRLKLNNEKKYGVLLMHFGMTGMVKIKDIKSHLTFMENGGDKKVLEEKGAMKKQKPSAKSKPKPKTSKYFKKDENEVKEEEKDEFPDQIDEIEEAKEALALVDDWPPRFTKFEMELVKDDQKLEFAFTDPRRLGRVRLLTGSSFSSDEKLLEEEPLSLLGPDYSKSRDSENITEFEYGDPDPYHHGRPRLSLEDFNKIVLKKKRVIKSFLLDQEFFAGVGNWVSDEILYHAKIHPTEILSDKLELGDEVDERVKALYDSLIYVCEKSVQVEGNVREFPSDWLMLYRWGKARKKGPQPKTATGHSIDFETVGGRTSCFVPEVQKLLVKKRKNEGDNKTHQKKKRKGTK